jgi:DnaA family protein
MQQQIPLGFHFNDEVTLESYRPGPNVEALDAVRQLTAQAAEPFVYLWGRNGVGKSHLLQASGLAVTRQNRPVALITLRDHEQYPPQILQGLEQVSLVCIDDVDVIENTANQAAWEEALFHLFNRVRDCATPLLVTASVPPAQLNLQLNDLKSRLGWGLTFQLRSISDDQKIAVLQQRAQHRGMELNAEVGRYLVTRFSRDMGSLMALLETLDNVSLAEQRRLTIPFVKQAIAD